ncbi:MAG TPA: hypothetical protein VGN95_01495 [Pyrinomonadaceae bacterium]|jgi:hypothetical protein|nr:hypothetical protein [Pyrinomonadaceae bacterium]
MAADSVFYKYNLRLDELDDQFCEYIAESREMNELLERIALVVGKTYSERGDAYQLADDVALMQIRDLLLQHDPDILCFSKEQKMSRLRERLRRRQQEWLINHQFENDDM